MKTVMIVLGVALVSAVVSGVWYFKNRFYVPDKNGMVYNEEEQTAMNDKEHNEENDDRVNNS